MLEKLEELWYDYSETVMVVALITIVLGLIMWGASTAGPATVTGTVIDKMYSPSTLSTGVGVAGNNPVVVSTGKSERWSLVIRNGAEIYTYEVSVSIYYNVEIGQEVTMECSTILGMIGCSSGVLK